jgi:hypothetical protein
MDTFPIIAVWSTINPDKVISKNEYTTFGFGPQIEEIRINFTVSSYSNLNVEVGVIFISKNLGQIDEYRTLYSSDMSKSGIQSFLNESRNSLWAECKLKHIEKWKIAPTINTVKEVNQQLSKLLDIINEIISNELMMKLPECAARYLKWIVKIIHELPELLSDETIDDYINRFRVNRVMES